MTSDETPVIAYVTPAREPWYVELFMIGACLFTLSMNTVSISAVLELKHRRGRCAFLLSILLWILLEVCMLLFQLGHITLNLITSRKDIWYEWPDSILWAIHKCFEQSRHSWLTMFLLIRVLMIHGYLNKNDEDYVTESTVRWIFATSTALSTLLVTVMMAWLFSDGNPNYQITDKRRRTTAIVLFFFSSLLPTLAVSVLTVIIHLQLKKLGRLRDDYVIKSITTPILDPESTLTLSDLVEGDDNAPLYTKHPTEDHVKDTKSAVIIATSYLLFQFPAMFTSIMYMTKAKTFSDSSQDFESSVVHYAYYLAQNFVCIDTLTKTIALIFKNAEFRGIFFRRLEELNPGCSEYLHVPKCLMVEGGVEL